MATSTHGLRLRTQRRWLRSVVELLSSMRFAVTLLTLICIAACIGTIVRQQEPYANYINQFGPLWAQVFSMLGLYAVYSSWWFLLVLFFLVISTTLCVVRNTPQILKDLRNFKTHLRLQGFKAFAHNDAFTLPCGHALAPGGIRSGLEALGFKTRTQQREGGVLIAARAGAGHKWGYIAAHSAIVLVCVGGLLDGEALTKIQMWLGDKEVFRGGGLLADVPQRHRLPDSNPAYRVNLLVSEGQMAGTAISQHPDGVLLQELPFTIELRKFVVEHYSTGMPRLFASDIVIHDRASGKSTPARVEVNRPAHYQGVSIYQSSFDDGGSSVLLQALPLKSFARGFEVKGVIGGASPLSKGQESMRLEYTTLRTMNVETFGRRADGKKDLRNVGPSIGYKLRDAAGQAREYHNYMLPVQLDDSPVAQFMLGVRETADASFRYWRVPADGAGKLDTFLRLYARLHEAREVQAAIGRYAQGAAAGTQMREALKISAQRVMSLFARGGLEEVARVLQEDVPQEHREKISTVLVRILNDVLFELAGNPRFEHASEWMRLAVLALSEATHYPSPLVFMLKDFTQVQASVFQVTKTPGQPLVYLGAVLLIAGVCLMLLVRERRVWVWVQETQDLSTPVHLAYWANRKTFAGDQEFMRIRQQVRDTRV